MNNKELIKQLQLLKNINPDPSFVDNAREIFVPAQKRAIKLPTPLVSFGISFAALFLVIWGATLIFLSEPVSPSISLDSDNIESELVSLSANIHLDEIEYHQDINQVIAMALDEIGSTKASHLNSGVIRGEQDYVEGFNLEESGNIDKMLDKLIF